MTCKSELGAQKYQSEPYTVYLTDNYSKNKLSHVGIAIL